MSKKIYRLNRNGNSNYALFIVEGNTVTFRRFRFYTGPMDKEETMTLEEGRKLYREMINEWVEVKRQ